MTFNTIQFLIWEGEDVKVLNLVINGWPSILLLFNRR